MNNNISDFAIRVATRGGKMTQEPLYPEGHPKELNRIHTGTTPLHLVLIKRKRKRKMIGLCTLLVNLK